MQKNSHSTADFIELILRWWNIVNVKTPHKGWAKRLEDSYPITKTNFKNLFFLEKFSSWLESWESLNVPHCSDNKTRYGKLTLETFTALKHTCKTLVTCSYYLLNEMDYNYILLAKFQTDQLEKRFGLYRSTSGCNYNVSVTQILESEKKIKVMNLLKVRGDKSSNFVIKYLRCTDNVPDELEDCSRFNSVFNSVSLADIHENDVNILIYISGYVAFSTSKKIDCNSCRCRIYSDRTLECDIPQNLSQYLELLDRGGLKWPTTFMFNLCASTYLIFQKNLQSLREHFLEMNDKKKP